MKSFSKHLLSKLKQAPELSLDRQTIVLGKHQLLAEINRRQEARRAHQLSHTERLELFYLRFGRKLIPRYQFVVGLFLIFAVTTSTGVMAQAAVPGDLLWPVKLSFEKAELALAVDPMQESRIHLRHADNRLKELTVMVARQDVPERNYNISQLVRRLEKDITAADQSLKISKEEKKDTHPQLIVALAQDINDKAVEAVKALEQNKLALTSSEPSLMDSVPGVPTSTESIAPSDTSLPTSSTSTASGTVAEVQVKRDLKQVLTEVQVVNEYISYNALHAMIEMIERGASQNRPQVTELLKQRIHEQRTRWVAVHSAVQLINDDFALHRSQAASFVNSANELLTEAERLVNLDNLSPSLKRLNEAKDLIAQAARVLQEVEAGQGFRQTEVKLPPLGKVMIQAVSSSTDATVVPSTTVEIPVAE